MKRTLHRVTTLGLAAAVTATMAFVGTGTAQAAPNQYAPSIGTAVGNPLSAPTVIPTRIRTTAACPAGTEAINAFINSTDANMVDAVAIGGSTTEVGNLTTTGALLDNNLQGIAQSAGRVLVNGRYEISVVCYPDTFGSPATAQFDGVFNVTGGTGTGAGTTATYETPALPASTTTLTVSPASPQNAGVPVTLTATVASSAAIPAGTSVEFRDGAAVLGSGTTNASGVATFTTSTLAGGAHSFTAVFAGTAAVQGSTSAAVPYTITAPAAATTTTLSSSPAAPTTVDVVTLSAAVAPSAGAGTVNGGTVTFSEGATVVGTGTVSGGVATTSLVGVTAGTHTYTASYGGNASWLTSTSAAATVTVTAFAGVSAQENITVTIPAGTLTITAGGTVDLGTAALNAANTLLVTAPKDINTVTVTDTRAGQLGWTVNGAVTDFSGPGSSAINSENLGWTPRVISQLPVQNVTAGPAVAPGAGVAVGATSGAGIKAAKLLASASTGGSVGTAELTAALVLQAPTSTTAGVYNATLTLTAL